MFDKLIDDWKTKTGVIQVNDIAKTKFRMVADALADYASSLGLERTDLVSIGLWGGERGKHIMFSYNGPLVNQPKYPKRDRDNTGLVELDYVRGIIKIQIGFLARVRRLNKIAKGADVSAYSGTFNLGSEPNTWAEYCLYVHSDVDKMKQTLINRLDVVMRDIKSVEKKIKKHAIAKSAATYDAV